MVNVFAYAVLCADLQRLYQLAIAIDATPVIMVLGNASVVLNIYSSYTDSGTLLYHILSHKSLYSSCMDSGTLFNHITSGISLIPKFYAILFSECFYAGAYAVDPTGSVPVKLVTQIPANLTHGATSMPFILKYAATSVVGNFSAIATRSISVIDPCNTTMTPGQFTCKDTMQCSVNGM
jgi:hypothetical protein